MKHKLERNYRKVLTYSNEEDYGSDVFKAVNPFPSFRSLATDIDHP